MLAQVESGSKYRLHKGKEEARVKLGQVVSAGVLSVKVNSVRCSVVSDSL